MYTIWQMILMTGTDILEKTFYLFFMELVLSMARRNPRCHNFYIYITFMVNFSSDSETVILLQLICLPDSFRSIKARNATRTYGSNGQVGKDFALSSALWYMHLFGTRHIQRFSVPQIH